MEIKTKYNLGQELFYMNKNKVSKGTVDVIMVTVLEEDDINIKYDVSLEEPERSVEYDIAKTHITFKEADEKLFETKEELINSL